MEVRPPQKEQTANTYVRNQARILATLLVPAVPIRPPGRDSMYEGTNMPTMITLVSHRRHPNGYHYTSHTGRIMRLPPVRNNFSVSQ